MGKTKGIPTSAVSPFNHWQRCTKKSSSCVQCLIEMWGYLGSENWRDENHSEYETGRKSRKPIEHMGKTRVRKIPKKAGTTLKELILADHGEVCNLPTISRFNSDGWFPVGITITRCPQCRSLPLYGFRKPYITRRGDQYHYWALFCRQCANLFDPASLDEKSKKMLKMQAIPVTRKEMP